MTAAPDCASVRRPPVPGGGPDALDKLLRVFSLLTMAMTVPQVVAVWRGSAEGVSAWSWAAYLASACLWMVHGLRRHDPAIWLPCLGWIALDAAIVVGALVRG
jgi:hypothetical protein